MKRREFLASAVALSLAKLKSPTIDLAPSKLVTLNAWGDTLQNQVRLVSSSAQFPLMEWASPPSICCYKAWLYLRVSWRSGDRPLYADVFPIIKPWGENITHGDFDRDYFSYQEMGGVKLTKVGWHRAQISAIMDYWRQVYSHGLVVMPLPGSASVQYSIDKVFLRVERV